VFIEIYFSLFLALFKIWMQHRWSKPMRSMWCWIRCHSKRNLWR